MSGRRGKEKRPRGKAAREDGGDDDDEDGGAPEEVSSSSVQIQELRQLHEAMVAPAKAKRAKKASKVRVDADKELSSDLLAGLAEEDFELNAGGGGEEDDEGENEDGDENEDSRGGRGKGRKIDKMRNESKKFGHVSVSTLETDDAVDAFIKSAKGGGARSTLELVASTQARTRFGVFAAQKTKGPAKVFVK